MAKPPKAKRPKAKRPSAKPPKAKKVARSFSTPTLPEHAKQSGSWFFPRRVPGQPFYWLLKQEPTDFSYEDLLKAPSQTTNWNGVRNFVARTFLRDHIKKGDKAFYYYSGGEPSRVAGIVDIVRDGYPDATQFDKKSMYYDPDSTPDAPRWFQVDVRASEKLPYEVTIADIKKEPALAALVLLHISQLSVQPVTKAEWDAIVRLARGR
ncbi:MAG TPA: EVE domain-containing protein [Gemmatimonadaceae bacterium]|nr:EVE domain-containing protein [Gemmatimonadaceae bacterium]